MLADLRDTGRLQSHAIAYLATHADHFELCVPELVHKIIFSYARSLFSSRFIGTFLLSNFWTPPPTHPPTPPLKTVQKSNSQRKLLKKCQSILASPASWVGVGGQGGGPKLAKQDRADLLVSTLEEVRIKQFPCTAQSTQFQIYHSFGGTQHTICNGTQFAKGPIDALYIIQSRTVSLIYYK